MKNTFVDTNKKVFSHNLSKGYAVLFTLIIVSIILSLVVGLSNSINKQSILASTAHDSQVAFYQADTAGECALYALETKDIVTSFTTPWSCGRDQDGNPLELNISQNGSEFTLEPDYSSVSGPCFKVNITAGDPSIIKSHGYNICDDSNPRHLERGMDITYTLVTP